MSIPYIPLFVAEFEADTLHLTMEQDGAFNRLLRLCWRTPGCSVPDDRTWIQPRLRVDDATWDQSVQPVIDEFFTRDGGRISSPHFDEWTLRHRRMTARPAIPPAIARSVWSRDGSRCQYCGTEEGPFHLDHIHPWSRGGGHAEGNLCVACRACNWAKRDKTVAEWLGGEA